MQVFGSRNCVHCRSVVNLLTIKGIPFEFTEMYEETDQVRVVDGGITYMGLDEIMNMIKERYGGEV
jgi:arsenate reductase-like glutaredoxin family protein